MTEAVCFDLGSCTTKIGNAGDDSPSKKIPSFVATPKSLESGANTKLGDELILPWGSKPLKWGFHVVSHPVEAGNLFDLSDPKLGSVFVQWMSRMVFEHLFNLRGVIEETPFVFCSNFAEDDDASMAMTADQENKPNVQVQKLSELMFEELNVPKVLLLNKDLCSLVGSFGDFNGCVVDMGGGSTRVQTLRNGRPISTSSRKIVPIGGIDMIANLRHHTNLFQPNTNVWSDDWIKLSEVFREVSFVPLDYAQEEESFFQHDDRNKISMSIESNHVFEGHIDVSAGRFEVPEDMFRMGLIDAISSSIHSSSSGDREKNVSLCGGIASIRGMRERVSRELHQEVDYNVKVAPCRSLNLEDCCWVGGSILGSLEDASWLTKMQYEEIGR